MLREQGVKASLVSVYLVTIPPSPALSPMHMTCQKDKV